MFIKLPSHWRRLSPIMRANYTRLDGSRTTDRHVIGDEVFVAKTTGNKLLRAIDNDKEAWRSFVIGALTVEVPPEQKDMVRMKPAEPN